MLTTDIPVPFSMVFGRFAGESRVEPAIRLAGTTTRTRSPGGLQSRESLAEGSISALCAPIQ